MADPRFNNQMFAPTMPGGLEGLAGGDPSFWQWLSQAASQPVLPPDPQQFSQPVNFLRDAASSIYGFPARTAAGLGEAGAMGLDWLLTPEAEWGQPGGAVPEALSITPGVPGRSPAAGSSFSLGPEMPFPQMGGGAAPDFSEAEQWLSQTAPQASTNPEEARKQRLQDWLAGLLGAVGSVDGGEAGIGRLLALAAGGGAGALSASKREERELGREDAAAQRAYAGGRADFAASKAQALSAHSQRNAAARYRNELAAYERGSAKLIDAKDGYLITQKGNTISAVPFGASTAAFDQLESMAEVLGEDHASARQKKYDTMVDQQIPLEAFQAQIVKDILFDGLGPEVFDSESVTTALTDAEERIPATLTGKDALPLVYRDAAGYLLGSHINDPSWLLRAAQLGNYGAQLLLQGSVNDGLR